MNVFGGIFVPETRVPTNSVAASAGARLIVVPPPPVVVLYCATPAEEAVATWDRITLVPLMEAMVVPALIPGPSTDIPATSVGTFARSSTDVEPIVVFV